MSFPNDCSGNNIDAYRHMIALDVEPSQPIAVRRHCFDTLGSSVPLILAHREYYRI